MNLNGKLRKAKSEGWADWIRNEHDERAVADGCYFDERKADDVAVFFAETLKHSQGEWGGKPFELLDWQYANIIAPIFGWMRPNHTRRIRRTYFEIAKKNGKSTLASGVGLYLLFADDEPGAKVYSAATKRDQALIVHQEAMNMVRSSAMFGGRLRINRNSSTIVFDERMASYTAIATDGAGAQGFNIHGLIIDELHVWTDRVFWESLRYGEIARRQPLVFVITTAGVRDKEGLGWQEHEYGKRWLAGDVENQDYYAYIAAAPEDCDITDPEMHRLANPSYGEIIDPEEIAKSSRDAIDKPSELNAFKRYRLNIWTEATSSWLDMTQWDKCGEEPIDEDALAGRKCFGGLDLAKRMDLTAWVLVFPPTDDDAKWTVLPRFWVPSESAKSRTKNDGVKYMTWGTSGALTLTDGNETDYGAVREQIIADRAKFAIEKVGGDPWNLTDMRQQLDPNGEYIVEFGQNFGNFTGPTDRVSAMVANGDIAHGGHPVLRWCVANVQIVEDMNGNIRPSKKHSTEKIDGAVAMLMALGLAMVEEEEPAPAVFYV